jgi:hypothetical protein
MLQALQPYAAIVALAACALAAIGLIWLIVLSRRVRTVTPHLRRLVRDLEGRSAAEVLAAHLGNMDLILRRASEVNVRAQELSQRQRYSVQKVAFRRFNAKPDIGGELSFALALLDEQDNGVLLTSIYHIEESRIYGRKITGGQATAPLLPEEQAALTEALRVRAPTEGSAEQIL